MLTRALGAAALSLVFLSINSAANAGAIQRMSCSVVRFYVAKYSAPAAESYARSRGATDAQIEAARRCLTDAPARAVEAAHWFTR
jgi:hypothetical protein